jgi:hypothetical protein
MYDLVASVSRRSRYVTKSNEGIDLRAQSATIEFNGLRTLAAKEEIGISPHDTSPGMQV